MTPQLTGDGHIADVPHWEGTLEGCPACEDLSLTYKITEYYGDRLEDHDNED